MTCPYCGYEAARRALHLHLVEQHVEQIELALDEQKQQMYYRLACPSCPFSLRNVVRPRSTDRSFLDEYRKEIGLVAFDLVLYHVEAAHEEPAAADAPPGAETHLPVVSE